MFTAAFVGRDDPGKGLEVLLEAWARSGLRAPAAELLLIGPECGLGPRTPREVRNFLHASSVLVVPLVCTRTFRSRGGSSSTKP